MTQDTAIGGPQARFPETRHSAIRGLQGGDATLRRQSYERIVTAYWKPVYKYLRLRWRESNEQAKDLTQAFFTHAIERETLTRYDAERATFRTYLRTCLDGFVLNARKSEGRLKRAGDATALSLDFEGAEGEIRLGEPVSQNESLEDFFQREWMRRVFALAVDQVRMEAVAQDRQLQLQLFEAYDLSGEEVRPTYQELADRFGIRPTTVTNALSAMRRDLRKAVLATLRELTATEREYRSEARALLGRDPS